MEGSTTIEELSLAVTQYAKEGTEDRDIIEKFCIEYINLLEEDSSILDRADFKESFSLLINEIGMNTLTDTEEGDTLWSILLDCWTSYGTQHDYSKGIIKAFNDSVNYTFDENYRNIYGSLQYYNKKVLSRIRHRHTH